MCRINCFVLLAARQSIVHLFGHKKKEQSVNQLECKVQYTGDSVLLVVQLATGPG